MENNKEELVKKYRSILVKSDLYGKKNELKSLENESYRADFWQ